MSIGDILRCAVGSAARFSGVQALFQRREPVPGGCERPGKLLSPCEGIVQEIGLVDSRGRVAGKTVLAQPRSLDLKALLGNDETAAPLAASGEYIVIYLAPWHLHYVLFPVAGACTFCRELPGRCLPLFLCQGSEVENERLVVGIDTEMGFPMVVILVGSFLVSSLTTACREGVDYRQGDYLGAFGLGSTVIIVAPEGQVSYDVNVGDKLLPLKPIASFTEADHAI